MSKKPLLICLILFVHILTILSQDSLKLYGPYGGDMRVRPSYGIIPDENYKNCVKIKNLDSKKIAIAVKLGNFLIVTKENFWGIKNQVYSCRFNVEDYVKTLIFSSPAQLNYNFKLFEKSDEKKISYNIWTGNLKVKNKTVLDSLSKKYDSDYLILINSAPSNFFRFTKSDTLAAGLHTLTSIYTIYACQDVFVFNLKTGKKLNSGYFPQESADIIPLILKKDYKDFSEKELLLVDKILEERLRNNLHQSFKLLGLE